MTGGKAKSRILSRLKILGALVAIAAQAILVGCQSGSTTTVSGNVTDEVGVAVAAALVEAEDGSASTTTDEDGDFTIELPADDTDVMISREGFTAFRMRAVPRHRGRAHFAISDGGGGPCKRMDADGDGVITLEEWKGPEDVFVTIDEDEDGTLTKAELEAARDKHRQARQEAGKPGCMDADEDGFISKEEWLGPEDKFEKIDADGNGLIGVDEMHAAWEARRRHRFGG